MNCPEMASYRHLSSPMAETGTARVQPPLPRPAHQGFLRRLVVAAGVAGLPRTINAGEGSINILAEDSTKITLASDEVPLVVKSTNAAGVAVPTQTWSEFISGRIHFELGSPNAQTRTKTSLSPRYEKDASGLSLRATRCASGLGRRARLRAARLETLTIFDGRALLEQRAGQLARIGGSSPCCRSCEHLRYQRLSACRRSTLGESAPVLVTR